MNPLAEPLPWNLVSADYAAEIVPPFEGYADAALDLADVRAGHAVVDVACGPGTLTVLAARRGARVRALDFASEMVGLARGRTDGLDVEVTEGDGQALPWADASADAGFSMFGLIFFPDRDRGLRELARVVRPGGPVVVSSWFPLDQVPAFAAMFGALAALTGRTGEPGPLADPAAIRAEALAAGFARADVHRVVRALPATSAGAFVDGMVRTLAPLVLMRRSMGDAWPAFEAALRARVVAELGDGPLRVEMPAWVSVLRT